MRLEYSLLDSLTEREVREGLAVGLYANGKLTMKEASELAGVSPADFEFLLRKQSVPRHYTRTDFPDLHPHNPLGGKKLREPEPV